MASSLRYARTLRYLRPVQIYGRLRRQLYLPRPDTSPAPPLRRHAGPWCEFAVRPPSMEGPERFRFLNRQGQVSSPGDWNSAGHDKLWLYNLHYFDDLNAAGRAGRRKWHGALVARWAAENPPGHGNGWEPYPLSLRIVNWIKWALAGHALDPSWLQSLAVQVRFLRARLEWHLLGNHLFANAKALVFAGLFFEGREADEWRATGLGILQRELPEQVLEDGGHFELSPMYHAIIQEDMLDLINLAQSYSGMVAAAIVADWCKVLQRMRFWLRAMVHPDGEIAFFNDAALGVAAPPAELESYATRLGLPACLAPAEGITHLEQSGYIRVQLGALTALLDVGCVGPDYLPGHAHADSLSFELSFARQRVIVNAGTSIYGDGAERLRQRSTAAHSTVEVNGESSSEVWGGFRVARRARPFGLRIEQSAETVQVHCAHDGYRRLRGRVTHWREWSFTPNGCTIVDRLDGACDAAVGHLHLHPSVQVLPDECVLLAANGRLGYAVEGGVTAVVPDSYHPRFGVTEPTSCLEVLFSGARSEVRFSLPNARAS